VLALMTSAAEWAQYVPPRRETELQIRLSKGTFVNHRRVLRAVVTPIQIHHLRPLTAACAMALFAIAGVASASAQELAGQVQTEPATSPATPAKADAKAVKKTSKKKPATPTSFLCMVVVSGI
jgi:hypothetical protein